MRPSPDVETVEPTDRKLPVRVITPHSGLDAFEDAIRSLVRDFPQSRALAWRMLVRDTRAMYRQSLLGYVWLFLPPLATVLVWVLLNSTSLVHIDSGNVPYPLFVLTGTVLWTAFNASVMAMQEIMGTARSALSKVNFPHEALVMTAFGKAVTNSVIPVLLLVPALALYRVTPEASGLLFPLGFVALMLLGSAIGLLFVPLGALYGDVGRAIQLALRFGFFLTPVIYALPTSGFSRTLLLINPVTAPLVSGRAWLLGSESSLFMPTVIVLIVSIVLLLLSTIALKVVMPFLIERLNV
jgi:homopolymeric O-antigen transport system permease protein